MYRCAAHVRRFLAVTLYDEVTTHDVIARPIIRRRLNCTHTQCSFNEGLTDASLYNVA